MADPEYAESASRRENVRAMERAFSLGENPKLAACYGHALENPTLENRFLFEASVAGSTQDKVVCYVPPAE